MTLRSKFPAILVFLMLAVAACGGEQAPDASDHDEATESDEITETQTAPDQAEREIVRLNINTVTEAEMLSIPDVGNRMVHEFEEYRPYTSIEQFRREIGKYVDEAQVAAYEQYIYVPIDPNESDAATLQQIPGIGADEAEKLIAGRPYASSDAFLEAVAAFVTQEDAATAVRFVSGL